MKSLMTLALAGLLVPAAPALAVADSPSTTDADKVVCIKTSRKDSNIPKRDCRPKSEWDKLRDDAQGLAAYQGTNWGMGSEAGNAPTGNNNLTGPAADNGAPF